MKPESQQAAADRLTVELGFPVSRKQVRLWKIKGFPLDDAPALRRCLGNQERVGRRGSTPKSETAKGQESRAKTLADMLAEREAGLFVKLAHFAAENFPGMEPDEIRRAVIAIGWEEHRSVWVEDVTNPEVVAGMFMEAMLAAD